MLAPRCSCGREVKGTDSQSVSTGKAEWNPSDCQVILGIIYFNALLYSKKRVPVIERRRYAYSFRMFHTPSLSILLGIFLQRI